LGIRIVLGAAAAAITYYGVGYALADGHGMGLDELAALMNEWRKRAVEGGQTTGFPLPRSSNRGR